MRLSCVLYISISYTPSEAFNFDAKQQDTVFVAHWSKVYQQLPNTVYDECKYSDAFWLADRTRLFVQYTISLSSLCKLIWRHWTYKMPLRYILPSVWVRLSILFPLSIIQYVRLYVFSLPISLVMIERIYILCLIIIIKSEVWTITHCSGLGHETMVPAVCLSIFLQRANYHASTVWMELLSLSCNGISISEYMGLFKLWQFSVTHARHNMPHLPIPMKHTQHTQYWSFENLIFSVWPYWMKREGPSQALSLKKS